MLRTMLELKVVVLSLVIAVCHAGLFSHPHQDVGEEKKNELVENENFGFALKTIGERLDRWDQFYMGRLEPRMIGAATSLANLDTNIRNLQERAHVWDTFQLHVAAWNEQIKSLDKKVNIINEGYEKLLSLESQISSALHLNGTLQAILTKLVNLDARTENLGLGRDALPVVGDFATRGLLHTVRLLERKMDRLQTTVDRLGNTHRPEEAESLEEMKNSEEFEVGKKTVSCSTPLLDDMLRDISAKVDSIFDKNEGMVVEFGARHSGRACKRLVAPYKRLVGSVEYVKSVVEDLVEDSPIQVESMALRHRRRLPALDEIKESLEDVERSIVQLGRQQDRNINENERILRRVDRKVEEIAKDDDDLKEIVTKKLNRIEKIVRDINDDDDSEEKKKKSRKNDTDEDDSEDEDDSREGKRRGSRNDSDDDDDDSKEKKSRRKDRNDSDDDDDDDNDTKERKSKRKHSNDSDDDDDDDTKEKKSRRKDQNDSDDDDDDNDTKEKKSRRKDQNDSDDDDDDNDTKEKKSRRQDQNDSDDDDDDNDTKEKKSRRKDEDDSDDDDDDDTKERKSSKKDQNDNDSDEDNDDLDTDEDDNNSDEDDENGNGRKGKISAEKRRKAKRHTEKPTILENQVPPGGKPEFAEEVTPITLHPHHILARI